MRFGEDRDKNCLRCSHRFFNHLRVGKYLYQRVGCQIEDCGCVGWTRDVPMAVAP